MAKKKIPKEVIETILDYHYAGHSAEQIQTALLELHDGYELALSTIYSRTRNL